MPIVADARPRTTRLLAGSAVLSLAFLAISSPALASGVHGSADEHPLGLLHPMLVHFPLALSLVAALAVLLGFVFRGGFFRSAVTFTITLGALFAVPTWWLGREAAASMGRMSEARGAVIGIHETWGTIAAAALLAAALLHGLCLLRPTSTALGALSRLAILAAAAVVSVAGYLGAEVVRGPDHLGQLLPF